MILLYGYIIVFSIIILHIIFLSILTCRTSRLSNNDVPSDEEVLSLLEEGTNISTDSSSDDDGNIINIQDNYIINKYI